MPKRGSLALALVGLLAVSACSAPGGGDSTGSATGADDADDAAPTLVVADRSEPDALNPLMGYAQYGTGLVYDGLLQMQDSGSGAVDLVPKLAAEEPTISSDGLTWTVKLREGVTYSDGSAFDAADVTATFNAMIDPKSASTIASDFDMLDIAEAADARTVRFTLKYPYAEFDSRLLLGIAPSEAFTGVPAADMSLNTAPVGTGAYVLSQRDSTQHVFTPREGTQTGIAKITVVSVEDDNTRAQRMSAGELDGTLLPPTLSTTFDGKDGYHVLRAKTVDFRGISLPGGNVFTKEPQARKAMNMAVDRQLIIDQVLQGHGEKGYTPIPSQVGEAYEPSATFTHDLAAAQKLLDDAGWVAGSDGIRAKGGVRASFPLMYPAADTLRRDFAAAFVADMKKLGVEVSLEGLTWDKIEAQLDRAGYVAGGGKYPTSVDSLLYTPLHRRDATTSSPYSNAGNFGSDEMDKLLDGARREQDASRRQEMYREIQKRYVEDPSYVYLAFLTHDYVLRDGAPGSDGTAITEPHAHDPLWGPWWDLGQR